jgi:hypothetical protein
MVVDRYSNNKGRASCYELARKNFKIEHSVVPVTMTAVIGCALRRN